MSFSFGRLLIITMSRTVVYKIHARKLSQWFSSSRIVYCQERAIYPVNLLIPLWLIQRYICSGRSPCQEIHAYSMSTQTRVPWGLSLVMFRRDKRFAKLPSRALNLRFLDYLGLTRSNY